MTIIHDVPPSIHIHTTINSCYHYCSLLDPRPGCCTAGASTRIHHHCSRNGQYGHGGDGRIATEASFDWVAAVVETKNGDVYVLDSNAFVVRKITKSTGTITTIAGIPHQRGSTGDGGPAVNAKFYFPTGLYFDELSGSLYIADSNRIRMIDSAGKISTVAGNGVAGFSGDGGLATEAKLQGPYGIIGNDKGELFIADTWNHRIRKVDVDKTISTIAGNGIEDEDFTEGAVATNSPLIKPFSLAINDEGELLVSTGKSAKFVVKIGKDGNLLKVAGNGVVAFSGDGSPAVDASLGDDIRIAIGKDGEVFIADTANDRIRMINSSGIISTIAGDSKEEYAGDGGPAIEASFTSPKCVNVASNGDIYVGDDTRLRMIYSSRSCYGLDVEDPNVCSGHGKCSKTDVCTCDKGWIQIDCSITHCFGITSNLPSVCSGKGQCVKHNECECDGGFRGHKCHRSPRPPRP